MVLTVLLRRDGDAAYEPLQRPTYQLGVWPRFNRGWTLPRQNLQGVVK